MLVVGNLLKAVALASDNAPQLRSVASRTARPAPVRTLRRALAA